MIEISSKKHTSPFSFFFAVNRSEIKWLILNSILYSTALAFSVSVAYILGRVIDLLQKNPGNKGMFFPIISLILVLVAREFFVRIGHIFEVTTSARIRENTKNALFSYTTKLSFGYFSDRFAGEIAHRISATAENFDQMKNIMIAEFIDNIVLILISAFTLAAVYPLLGVVVIVWAIFFITGIFIFGKYVALHSGKFADHSMKTTGTLVDMYANIATVKVYGRDFDKQRVYDQVNKETMAFRLLGKWQIFTYNFQGTSGIILCAALLWVAAHGYSNNIITLGGIVMAATISLQIYDNVWSVGYNVSSFISAYGECKQNLNDIIVAPSIIDGQHSTDWKQISLNYKNITFSYDGKKEVLKNFSFEIPAGKKIGVVGLSGAGKTTMINLLLRFFDVQKGSIEINGTDIRNLTQESLRSHISFISQDTSLFHSTIAENIQYGSKKVSRKKLEEIGKLAYANEFISQLPNGYDTIVGERGVKLSGGQRQRIAIARAMLKNSPLFILDEATSALDSDSEQKIQEALKVLMQNKTVIAIAHRLSTLQSMDEIVFVQHGKIIESGTHDELMTKSGQYAKLWNMQTNHLKNV